MLILWSIDSSEYKEVGILVYLNLHLNFKIVFLKSFLLTVEMSFFVPAKRIIIQLTLS